MVEQQVHQLVGGGSSPTSSLQVQVIDRKVAAEFVRKTHYAVTMPAITKLCFGGYQGGKLVAVSTWGYGTRPKHTIKKLFPTLDSKDYLELGRLALLDEMPRNSESHFLSICIRLIRKLQPDLKILFSWADGYRGKPGYVYQASNWLFGGNILTDAYITSTGEIVHPRRFQNKLQQDKKKDALVCGRRPSQEYLQAQGWRHIFGKQMRYCYLICPVAERALLLTSSTVEWSRKYPKDADLAWKERTVAGRKDIEQPFIISSATFMESPNV